MNVVTKKMLCSHECQELISGFIYFFFKGFGGGWEQRISLW